MAAPTVYMSEIDLSTRVPAFAGVYGAIVVPTNKGPVDKPRLVTSDTDLLRNFTVNETVPIDGNVAFFSALSFLEKSAKLWVRRCPGRGALFGGLAINKVDSTPGVEAWDIGSESPLEKPMPENAKCFIYGADPGAWNNNIKIKVFRHREIDEIKATALTDYIKGSGPLDINPKDSNNILRAGTDWQTGEPVKLAVPSPVMNGADISAMHNLPRGVNGNDTYYVVKESTVEDAGGKVYSKIRLSSSYQNAKATVPVTIPLTYREENFPLTGSWDDQITNGIVVGSTPALGWQTGDPVFVSPYIPNGPATYVPDELMNTCVYIINLGTKKIGGNPQQVIKFAATREDAKAGIAFGEWTWGLDRGNNKATDITITESVGIALMPLKDTKLPGTGLIEVFKGEDELNPIESWVFSRKEGTKDLNGKNIYINNLLEASGFIRGRNNTGNEDADDTADTDGDWEGGPTAKSAIAVQAIAVALAGGNDGTAFAEADMINCLHDFRSKETYPVTCLMDGGYTTISYQKEILKIAEERYDCIGYLNSRLEDELSHSYLNSIVNYKSAQLNPNSSYGGMFTPHAIILDRFNNVDRQIPVDGLCAANFAATAYSQEAWYPVGGQVRGALNVKDLTRRFSKGEMDYLYDNGINPIRFKVNKGISIWGQKTLSARPSKLDRLNVRALLIVIKPAIEEALEDFLFELNDEATRIRAVSVLKSYLEGIKQRRGVYDYEVKCDKDNNSDADIDNYLMNVWVFVSPVTAVEYIKCPVIITSTGASFSEAAMSL